MGVELRWNVSISNIYTMRLIVGNDFNASSSNGAKIFSKYLMRSSKLSRRKLNLSFRSRLLQKIKKACTVHMIPLSKKKFFLLTV